jgi:hypothetical protein
MENVFLIIEKDFQECKFILKQIGWCCIFIVSKSCNDCFCYVLFMLIRKNDHGLFNMNVMFMQGY